MPKIKLEPVLLCERCLTMNNQQYGKLVAEELGLVQSQISVEETEAFIEVLSNSQAVFIAGAGRSGYMARGFAMRLMHMGLKSYMVGDTGTTAISKDDVLVICSGSGETKSLVSMADKAKSLGAKVVLITINPASTVGLLADFTVRINAPSPKAVKEGDIKSVQPMGNLFEQSLLIYLDICVILLMNKMEIDSEMMFTRHANLE